MHTLYYIQTNLACIVILLMFLRQTKHRSDRFSTNRIVFNRLIMAAIVICISDAAAGCFGGLTFPGAHAVIEISNMIYFVALTVSSCLWMLYVEINLNDSKKTTKKEWY